MEKLFVVGWFLARNCLNLRAEKIDTFLIFN
jgi:hypothetical protein